MKLSAVANRKGWERRLAVARKQIMQPVRRPCTSTPVFVLGKQRSGTSMLMFVFHRHPDTLVFDEHKGNAAFNRYRLRGTDDIRRVVEKSRYPFVCFKPISDSHQILKLFQAFPDGHFIWLYRDYRDTANSSLRKFAGATRAIRLVCTGQQGGGWFQDGISPPVEKVLRDVYRPDLPDFDLACLVWWARNQIIFESGLIGLPNVTITKYEALVSQPSSAVAWLCGRIGMPYRDRIVKTVSARSISRHRAPDLDASVQQLCDESLEALDEAFYAADPPPMPEN